MTNRHQLPATFPNTSTLDVPTLTDVIYERQPIASAREVWWVIVFVTAFWAVVGIGLWQYTQG